MENDDNFIPYNEVQTSASIRIVRGSVKIPPEMTTVNVDDLVLEMRQVVDIAVEIYNNWLESVTIVNDNQLILLLTFKANIPEKYLTLRVNLSKIADEINNGLSPIVLRKALDILK